MFFIQAREAVEMRVNLEKSKVKTIKEKKEQNLRLLAQKAREERTGIRREDVAGMYIIWTFSQLKLFCLRIYHVYWIKIILSHCKLYFLLLSQNLCSSFIAKKYGCKSKQKQNLNLYLLQHLFWNQPYHKSTFFCGYSFFLMCNSYLWCNRS